MEYRIYCLRADGNFYRSGNLCFTSRTANKRIKERIEAGLITLCVSYDSRYNRRKIRSFSSDGKEAISKFIYLDKPQYMQPMKYYIQDNIRDFQFSKEYNKKEYGWDITEEEWTFKDPEKYLIWLFQHDYIKVTRKEEA